MRNPLGPLARGWNRFWFAEVSALPFGLARIGLSLAGLQLWVATVPLVRRYYSDAGQYPIAEARGWGSEWASRFLMPDVLGSFEAAAVLFGFWGVALMALLLGYRARFAAVAVWLLTLWFHFRNPTFTNGGDEVLRLCTFYVALGFLALPPAARALSLDRLREKRRQPGPHPPARMPAWPLRLIQIQIALVYFVSGFWKVFGPPWWDGSALYYALDNSAFSRFGVPDWAWLRIPFTATTLAVAWWEFLFPALVTWKRTRRATLLFGVALHGLILVFMNIGLFPFVMVGLYPVFLKPDEVRGLVTRVQALVPRSISSRIGTTAAASP